MERLLVRDRFQLSTGVHDSKIPGRDGFSLRVPGGRDVGVRAVKYDNRRMAAVKRLALRVTARDVAVDGSKRSGVRSSSVGMCVIRREGVAVTRSTNA